MEAFSCWVGLFTVTGPNAIACRDVSADIYAQQGKLGPPDEDLGLE